jgi:GMP synthase (glutamine-hydrolysing)
LKLHRFVLLQARNHHDSARIDEHHSFARRLSLEPETVRTINILEEPLSPELLEDVDLLLVGGAGEYSVLDDLAPIRRFIDFLAYAASEGNTPIFASCFGFQALVLGLGGEVIQDEDNAEVGSYDISLTQEGLEDPLFGKLPPSFKAQLGHKDRAALLPSQLVRLAYSQRAPCQAVRLRNSPVYATQFHPELTGDDNRQRFLRYMEQYGRLFGEEEAQRQLDSHVASPQANALLVRFCDLFLNDSPPEPASQGTAP